MVVLRMRGTCRAMVHRQTSEFPQALNQQEILVLINNPSEQEEKFSKVVDMRIMVNKRKLETTRLKLARAISPACSASKMENDKT